MSRSYQKLYVVTRRDIPQGQAAAMILHAGLVLQRSTDLDVSQIPVVLLTVKDELELFLLEDRLPMGVAMWLEPDLDYGLAAIALLSDGHAVLDRLPLFLESESVTNAIKEIG